MHTNMNPLLIFFSSKYIMSSCAFIFMGIVAIARELAQSSTQPYYQVHKV